MPRRPESLGLLRFTGTAVDIVDATADSWRPTHFGRNLGSQLKDSKEALGPKRVMFIRLHVVGRLRSVGYRELS